MWKRRSTSLVPSGIGQLTLYHCQKKIRTKEGNSSDVIDLSNIDDTGIADRITKDDMFGHVHVSSIYCSYVVCFVYCILFYYFSSEHTVLRMLADKSY